MLKQSIFYVIHDNLIFLIRNYLGKCVRQCYTQNISNPQNPVQRDKHSDRTKPSPLAQQRPRAKNCRRVLVRLNDSNGRNIFWMNYCSLTEEFSARRLVFDFEGYGCSDDA